MPEYYSTNELLGNTYWHSKRYEYSSGDLIYMATHRAFNADDSDKNWQVYKLTWSSGDCTRIQGPVVGSWANRASLGW
uniref:Uncharacterized protein n=1 Tax=viral metagenome TaxID=1070528 RepID=A0A6M3JU69_9ZZZZ